jgi:perosamine synthetase
VNPYSLKAAAPWFPEEDLPGILADVETVLRSGRLILGPHTEALEAEFAASVGVKHAVAVSSCTAALQIALSAVQADAAATRSRGAHSPNRVLVPANTFLATAAAPAKLGLEVELVGLPRVGDGGLDVNDALRRLTPDVLAVIVTHIAGFIPEHLDELRHACSQQGIALIEDCAHAHGAEDAGGAKAGSLGSAGCFSFYPTKILTAGTGGMLTTNDAVVANRTRAMRHHGGAVGGTAWVLGDDWLMPEVSAVLARAQLRRLPEFLARRRAVAAAYRAAIHAQGAFITPPRPYPLTRPAYYKYPVTLPAYFDAVSHGAALRGRLLAAGVEVGVLYEYPVDDHPAIYPHLRGHPPKGLGALRRQLCLPMHARVDPVDCAEIVSIVNEAIFSIMGEPRLHSDHAGEGSPAHTEEEE